MNKKSIILAAVSALILTACGGQKNGNNAADDTDSTEFKQEEIESQIMAQLDSISDLWMTLKPVEGLYNNGKIQLSDDEKKAKPTYLLDVKEASDLSLLSQKYRAMGMLAVDRRILQLYDEETDVVDAALAKLATEVGDPAIKGQNSSDPEYIKAFYNNKKEGGRLNLFWEMASAVIVENLYVVSQNLDKFILIFDDKQASDLSYQIALLKLSLDDLATYDNNIKELDEMLAPLNELNAATVNDLKEQLKKMKPQIETIRGQLLR